MTDRSHCKKGGRCELGVIGDYEDAQVEDCLRCSKRLIYNKEPDTGRIDNSQYLRDHIRDFCQPFGPTRRVFAEVYGQSTLNEILKMAAERNKPAESIWGEFYDIWKTAKKDTIAF